MTFLKQYYNNVSSKTDIAKMVLMKELRLYKATHKLLLPLMCFTIDKNVPNAHIFSHRRMYTKKWSYTTINNKIVHFAAIRPLPA